MKCETSDKMAFFFYLGCLSGEWKMNHFVEKNEIILLSME